jgi:hypothetical protein
LWFGEEAAKLHAVWNAGSGKTISGEEDEDGDEGIRTSASPFLRVEYLCILKQKQRPEIGRKRIISRIVRMQTSFLSPGVHVHLIVVTMMTMMPVSFLHETMHKLTLISSPEYSAAAVG